MPPEVAARAVQVMKALNKEASRLMVELQTSACTDITVLDSLAMPMKWHQAAESRW